MTKPANKPTTVILYTSSAAQRLPLRLTIHRNGFRFLERKINFFFSAASRPAGSGAHPNEYHGLIFSWAKTPWRVADLSP